MTVYKQLFTFLFQAPYLFMNYYFSVAATKPVQEWSNNNNTWSDSPLWEKEIRTKVKDTKLTEHQLNISRSQCVKGMFSVLMH